MKFCEHCKQPLMSEFSWPEFSRLVRLELAERNLSLREAQTQTGVDQATIHRLAKHGKPIDFENMQKLLAFIKEPTP